MKNWEIKDRTYQLAGSRTTPWVKIQSKSNKRRTLLWFDEDKGSNKELRYSTNQKSIFVEDQDGHVSLSNAHIVFEDGFLHVPKNNQNLQLLLSIYHPDAGKKWNELNPEAKAKDDVNYIELELDALNLVTELEEEALIAILRTEYGSGVSQYTPSQIKRLGFTLAKKNPKLFIELAADEDVQLRNFANMAVELGLIRLDDNNTVFKYSSNGRKIFTVPFDQHPYQALAQYFKTDEGAELYKALEKKMK